MKIHAGNLALTFALELASAHCDGRESAAFAGLAIGPFTNALCHRPATKLYSALAMLATGIPLTLSQEPRVRNLGLGLVGGAICNTASAANLMVTLQRGSANTDGGTAPGMGG